LLDRIAGLPRIHDLYLRLCDVMHPAAGSIAYQLAGDRGSSDEMQYRHDLTTVALHIESIITEYRDAMWGLVHLSFDPGLITLQVLHRFKL
jgi:hypothetical protein